eukprot:TRINITY_DN6072_c0_g1_i5.p1 TRINITY_DN6072_c0_g1~~TRINITY_DN6072_c0_g1_i5.p1  ORF type:complete len:139 (-),score=7.42 TRINITY_DN6072_c0_g1_i5:95-511(-)
MDKRMVYQVSYCSGDKIYFKYGDTKYSRYDIRKQEYRVHNPLVFADICFQTVSLDRPLPRGSQRPGKKLEKLLKEGYVRDRPWFVTTGKTEWFAIDASELATNGVAKRHRNTDALNKIRKLYTVSAILNFIEERKARV